MAKAEETDACGDEEETYGGTIWAEVRSWDAARAAVMLHPGGECGEMHYSWNPYSEADDPIEHALLDLLMLARFHGRDVDDLLERVRNDHKSVMKEKGVEEDVRYGLDSDRSAWAKEILSKWNALRGGDDPLNFLSCMSRLGDGGKP